MLPRRNRAIGMLVVWSLAATTACATTTRSLAGPESPSPKSVVVPAFEIVAMDALINAAGRRLYDDGTFRVTPASIRRNLGGPWVIDDDSFEVNQIAHPYQGAMYHGFARATGWNYWQSVAYTLVGSTLWEIAGETTAPSVNDQIASGIAGTFFGESMFRIGNLLIDKAGGRPGAGRMALVAVLAPPTWFNRVMFGDRFDTVMPTFDPMYDVRLQFGPAGRIERIDGSPRRVRRDEAILDLSVEYGLPGKVGYTYTRPFDYFAVDVAVTGPRIGLESVFTRGLIVGSDYDAGPGGRGVWGLYGIYDYISPRVFRVSTTSLAVGTSVQWWMSGAFAAQTTALAGVGYAAAQTLPGTDDHRYGLAPQGLATLRLIAADRVSLDLAARGYLVSDIGGFETPTDDLILRGEAALGVRLFSRHAITLRYLVNRRETDAPTGGTQRQQRDTIGVFYTFLGPQRFGAVGWGR